MSDNYDGKIVIGAEVDIENAASDLKKLELVMNDCVTSLSTLSTNVTSEFTKVTKNFTSFIDESTSSMQGLCDSISRSMSIDLSDGLSSLFLVTNNLSTELTNSFIELREVITSSCISINEQIEATTSLIDSSFSSINLYTEGREAIDSFVRGMKASTSSVSSAASEISSALSSSLSYSSSSSSNSFGGTPSVSLPSTYSLSTASISDYDSSSINTMSLSDNVSSSYSSLGADTSSYGTTVYTQTPITIQNLNVRNDNDIYEISKELAFLSRESMYTRTGTKTF